MRITPILTALAILALASVPGWAADTDSASDAPSPASSETQMPASAVPTRDEAILRKGIPPCGPEVSAVLGGEDDTACLPNDIGTHGQATVPRGNAGSPAGTQERR
jgi:hypothetical protein